MGVRFRNFWKRRGTRVVSSKKLREKDFLSGDSLAKRLDELRRGRQAQP